MTELLDKLHADEAIQLAKMEAIVSDSLKLVSENLGSASEALKFIRENRLYRSTHTTFEAYCIEIWGKPVRTVRASIQAISVRRQLLDDRQKLPPDSKPEAERLVKGVSANVILATAKIKQDKRLETLFAANKKANGKPVTPKHVSEAAAALAHRPIPDLAKLAPPPVKRDGWSAVYGSASRPDAAPAIQPEINHAPAGIARAEKSAVKSMTFGEFRQAFKLLKVPDDAQMRFADGAEWRALVHARFDVVSNLVSFW